METVKKSKLLRYMSYTRGSLRLVGLWPRSGGVLYSLYFAVIAISMILQVVQMITNTWLNYTTFEDAAEIMGPMMALITSFGKLCIYRYQRTRLRRLIESVENCLSHGPADVLENLEDYGRVGSVACGCLLGASWLLTSTFLTGPLLANQGRILPFPSWYPFNFENSSILYAIAYGHEAVLTCLGSCALSTELTFMWSICHCCSRLRVLNGGLLGLVSTSERPASPNDKNDETFVRAIDVKLSSLARLHCEILRDVLDINFAYTHIVMILFLAALIAICCAGLQITSDSGDSDNFTAGLFLVLAMYYAEQMLCYYLPGELIAQEASAISYAAYASGWETLNVSQRRTIALMIMRSQFPLHLRTGELRPMRLENYGAFLTTTASYFTSLRAVAQGS